MLLPKFFFNLMSVLILLSILVGEKAKRTFGVEEPSDGAVWQQSPSRPASAAVCCLLSGLDFHSIGSERNVQVYFQYLRKKSFLKFMKTLLLLKMFICHLLGSQSDRKREIDFQSMGGPCHVVVG